jgi:hypothetical protein
MHDEITHSRIARDGEEAPLTVALAVLVRQAQRAPVDSIARAAMVDAIRTLRDALDDLTDARRIGLDRAHGLAEAAVEVGAASWGHDGAFLAAPALRARLSGMGVSILVELNDDEAEDVAAFLATV